jgi:hypothetical protein
LKKKNNKSRKNIEETPFYQTNISSEINMSTAAAAQPVLTVVKDEFTKVLTRGTLSPSTKATDWNVIITEKSLLEAMKALSPPPEETQNGLTTLYDTTFPTLEDYRKFTVNHLILWGNINFLTLFMLIIEITPALLKNYRNKLWHY